MQLQQIDRCALEPRKACCQSRLNLCRDVFEMLDVETELGGEIGRRAGFRQQPAERFLRLAVAIQRGRIDPIDPACERAASTGRNG